MSILAIVLVLALWTTVFVLIKRSPRMPDFPKRVLCTNGPAAGGMIEAPSLDARLWIAKHWWRLNRWGGPIPPGQPKAWKGCYAITPDERTQSLRLEWFPLDHCGT